MGADIEEILKSIESSDSFASISVRLDFYSDGYMEPTMKIFRKIFGSKFLYRPLSEEERFRVDISSVAISLNTYEENILKCPCYIFYADSEVSFTEVILNDYFIYLYIKSSGDTIKSELGETMAPFISFLKDNDITERISPVSMRMFSQQHLIKRWDAILENDGICEDVEELKLSGQRDEKRFETNNGEVVRIIKQIEPLKINEERHYNFLTNCIASCKIDELSESIVIKAWITLAKASLKILKNV